MKILYLHQYFKTPAQPGGTRSYWMARELVSRGHQVTMISASQHISKKKENQEIDGIRVVYLRIPYSNAMGIAQRLFSFLRFMLWSSWLVLTTEKPDLIIATSTPLTIGFPALVGRLFRRIPYLFEVRDLWPEVPIQMGGLKNSALKKLAITFEEQIYRKAQHIVALSPGMRDGVLKAGTPESKVSMIPNMAKIDQFWPRKVSAGVYESYGLKKDSFKVIHFGAMGLANGLNYILAASMVLKSNKVCGIDFIFLGDGAVKQELETIKQQNDLSNVYFLGKHPMQATSELVNACDVSLVTFSDLPILATNSPNKLFDSLSAGKPIVVNSNGWTREMVEVHECGFYVDAKKPDELADLLNRIKHEKTLLTTMGRNARMLAETKYDKSILCNEFADVVESKF